MWRKLLILKELHYKREELERDRVHYKITITLIYAGSFKKSVFEHMFKKYIINFSNPSSLKSVINKFLQEKIRTIVIKNFFYS